MGNWKLLGEVPDSDDEALDDGSHESQEESQPRNDPVADLGDPTDDIWDVPASLPREDVTPKPKPTTRRIEASATPTTPRQNLSLQNLPTDAESDGEIDLVREDPPGLSDLESSPFPSLTTGARHHKDAPKDNAALPTSNVQQPPSSPLSSLGSISDLSPSPPPPPPPETWAPPAEPPRDNRSPPRDNRSPSPFPVLPDSPPEFRLGFIRSLRPRKPIQQHPYLLENARYTRVMKSHGVKPVRVPYISENDKAVAGNDSQEQEFAEENSQGPPQEDTQSALPSSSLGPAGDVDVLRTPSPITSTPARRLLFPSSGGSGAARTDNTSLSDEDDFPSLHSFIRRRQQHGTALGHQDTASRKRAKTDAPTLRERTPSPKWIPVHIDLSPSPPAVESTSDPGHVDIYDPPGSPQDESDSDVPRSGRRIPASWLILDRRPPPSHAERAAPRRAATQADPVPRKGLALPKRGGTGAAAALDFMFDESDDDDVEVTGSRPRTQVEDEPEDDGEPYPYRHESYDMDDTQSVVEEDIIDRMTTGTKRGSSRKESTAKRRRTNNPFKGIPGQKTKQPKITKMLGRPASSARPDRHMQRTHSAPQRRRAEYAEHAEHAEHTKRTKPAYRKRQTALSQPPPMLSILDFVEPQAPDFIRIAARTARSRTRLGKASPSRKMINLGSRADNIDALSVLHNWKAGKIQPRVPASQKPVRRVAKQLPSVLGDLSPNLRQTRAAKESATTHARPMEPPKRTIHLKPVGQRVRAREASVRPAQLETTTPGGRLRKTYFVSRKKELDEMYRRRRRETSTLPSVHLERFIDNASVAEVVGEAEEAEEARPAPERRGRDEGPRRSRFRKRYDPQRVDTTAARFVHALDPLPMELGPVRESEETVEVPERRADKLLGLGPFGTQYSQHFDIFPLDGSVFFHASTLLGSGRLSRALGTSTESSQMPAAVETPLFQLDQRDLAWEAWDDNVSSEFGILLDWLADILAPSQGSLGIHTGRKVAEAVHFVLDFIPRSIATARVSEAVQQSFVQRCLDVLGSFAGRLEATTGQLAMQADDATTKNQLAALSGVLLVAVWMLRICREAPSCVGESFETEELLKRLAKLTMGILRRCGLQCVRTAYTDLQQPALRAHGIRAGQQVLVSWTLLIQVLGYARMPRAGFWDLAYAVLLDGFSMETCTDAGAMEGLWEDMFTLLPLGEVDSSGAVQPGLRQLVPLDGWALPRQAVSRVFGLYKASARQAPSFNAYCRAVVGRCHYLVAAWGWQQCSAMVGVIFDFFGEHDFAHLRNEEAHVSPAFLEALGRPEAPCLDVEADDRCFHIFLKMLGLVLQRLRRLGLTKELRNLLARTLPNHNRPLLREADVHPRDLAALRNHHDLLCTLFWATPPALRRGVHLIEKLVTPGSAHKEACLINIRAWNQLARFVVAAGEGYGVYKGFAAWMSGLFQQVLEQHQSAETELQRQFQQLSASMMRGISPHALRAMAAKNQAAATDVLHACVAAELDVLQHAPSLAVATYCFSGMQLEAIFSMFSTSSSTDSTGSPQPSDWSLFGVALDVVQHYLDRLQKAMDEQYSSTLDEGAHPVDAHDTEEAVLMLDHRLAKSFFQCTRALVAMPLPDGLRPGARAVCTERAVLLAGRLACRFVHAGVYRLSVFFGSGDYALFPRASTTLAPWRRYVPLFVAAVLENNVFDFQDVGASLLELWLLAVAAPVLLLGYEMRLAALLQRHGLPYVQGASLTKPGGYETSEALFACALSSMRRSLREAEAGRRQQLRGDLARALKRVMQQMREDLRSCVADAAVHARYVAFVRRLVALIKSHGGDICPLDAFFYQQSADYTPSLDDPQLQTAGIVAYGLRLGEGEATAAPQLFHYLHNNFHIALASNQLPQTCGILTRSLAASDDVLRFVLERMLPAVLRATRATPDAWPMLAVYCGALQAFLTRGAVARDVGGRCADEENAVAAAVAGLVAELLGWLRATHLTLTARLSCAQVHVVAQLAALAGALQPLVTACFCLAGVTAATRQLLARAVAGFGVFAAQARRALKGRSPGLLGPGRDSVLAGVAEWTEEETGQGQVELFSKMISRHVRENWVVEDGQIGVRRGRGGSGGGGPGTGGGTGGPGTAYGPWKMEELLEEVDRELSCWRLVKRRRGWRGGEVGVSEVR